MRRVNSPALSFKNFHANKRFSKLHNPLSDRLSNFLELENYAFRVGTEIALRIMTR